MKNHFARARVFKEKGVGGGRTVNLHYFPTESNLVFAKPSSFLPEKSKFNKKIQ